MESGNPYAPPRAVGGRPRVRTFPLRIWDLRWLSVDRSRPAIEADLLAWAAKHRFHMRGQTRHGWVLRRNLGWVATFAWDIRDVPVQVSCRYDEQRGQVRIRLLCRADWGVALPGDASKLARELDALEACLANRSAPNP